MLLKFSVCLFPTFSPSSRCSGNMANTLFILKNCSNPATFHFSFYQNEKQLGGTVDIRQHEKISMNISKDNYK